MPRTTLYLIRHGETAMNVRNIFRGRTDIPLNDNGLAQARQLAAALADVPLRAVYSSPMIRAQETARPLAEARGLAVRPMEEFHNICLGEWEGQAKEDVQTRTPELWQRWVYAPETLAIPGGESLADLLARAGAGLRKLAERHAGEAVAVVSHRSVVKAALAAAVGLEHDWFWKFYLDTGSYSVVEHQPRLGFTLTRVNESCHLTSKTEELF